LSTFLYTYARKLDLTWPFILYFNQFINAGVKIYMLFHLSKQKWSNRGNQSSGESKGVKERVALLQLATTVTAFVTGLAVYAGVLPSPWT
jgi:glycosyltransferase Alg8